MSGRKTIGPGLAVSVLAVLAALVAVEAALRLIGHRYPRFNDRSREYYTNPRNYYIPVGRDGAHTLYGLRYRETPEKYRAPDDAAAEPRIRPGRRYRILGLGDSFTYGQGVRYEDIYLSRLERLFEEEGEKTGVLNCGRSGARVETVIDIYREESAKRRYPVVVYGFVLNDFENWQERVSGSDFIDVNNGGNVWNPLRHASATVNFIATVLEKRRLHRVTVQAYLDDFRGDNARRHFEMLREFARTVERDGGRLVVVLFPLLYRFDGYPFMEIHETIRGFCAEEDIPLLDLLPAYARHRAEDLWAAPTDHHPNEVAHRIAAEQLYGFLRDRGLAGPPENR